MELFLATTRTRRARAQTATPPRRAWQAAGTHPVFTSILQNANPAYNRLVASPTWMPDTSPQ
eukprot:8702201-Lingulodinium_polyedra.AAC.1